MTGSELRPGASPAFPQGLMLLQQLAPEHVPVLSDDLDQTVGVLGMIPHELGELLDLPFEPLHPPQHGLQASRRFRLLESDGCGSGHVTLREHSFGVL